MLCLDEKQSHCYNLNLVQPFEQTKVKIPGKAKVRMDHYIETQGTVVGNKSTQSGSMEGLNSIFSV